MRFLVDECAGPGVAKWLRTQGHEVFSVYEQLPGASDDVLLAKANAEDWVLITNDGDFGKLVFCEGRPHRGVIFLRLLNERTPNKIGVLLKLLSSYESSLENQFLVVTESSVRIAGSKGYS